MEGETRSEGMCLLFKMRERYLLNDKAKEEEDDDSDDDLSQMCVIPIRESFKDHHHTGQNLRGIRSKMSAIPPFSELDNLIYYATLLNDPSI